MLAATDGLIQDAVICGHDRDAIGLLVWVNAAAAPRALGSDPSATEIAERLRQRLAAHNAVNPASSTRIQRLLMLADPPSIDAGEITDKGYVNQRAVLDRRADMVARLYTEPARAGVVEIAAPIDHSTGGCRSGDPRAAS